MALTGATGTLPVALHRGDETRPAVLRWRRGDPCEIELDDGPRASGPDLFEALTRLRRELEVDGWLIAVAGARLDAYPSGMARDMGGGERVYVTTMGRPATAADLVDTLAPEPDPAVLSTVEEQERRHDLWLRS